MDWPNPDKEMLPASVLAFNENRSMHVLNAAPVPNPMKIMLMTSSPKDSAKSSKYPVSINPVMNITITLWLSTLLASIGNKKVIGSWANWQNMKKYPAVSGEYPLSINIDGSQATLV